MNDMIYQAMPEEGANSPHSPRKWPGLIPLSPRPRLVRPCSSPRNLCSGLESQGSNELVNSIDKYGAVRLQAQAENLVHILESYHPTYVEKCFEMFREHGEVWEALKRSFGTFDIIRMMEIRMDHDAFLTFLTAGGSMLSGRDRDGRPIIWSRMYTGLYKMKVGSPQACAYIRACLWLFQIGTLKAFPGSECRMIYDDSERKLLDFNLELSREMGTLGITGNPAYNTVIIVAGAHTSLKVLWKLYMHVLGDDNLTKIRFIADRKDVMDIVSDPSDIPDWWLQNGTGRCAELSKNLLWEWERCLARGMQCASAAEIFNPQEMWTDVELTKCTTKGPFNDEVLGTILEEDESR
jgi:hypothetical protein